MNAHSEQSSFLVQDAEDQRRSDESEDVEGACNPGDQSFGAAPSQYPRKTYDDTVRKDWNPELQMDLYGRVVSDIHGRTRERLDVDTDTLPLTTFQLLRERCRNERRIEKLLQTPEARLVWDVIMDEDGGCSEDEELAVRLFIVRDADGRVAIDERARWPKHVSYAEVARQLHFIDPVKFRNEEGDVPSREVTKILVLRGFAKKHHAFLVKYEAIKPTYPQVREKAEYYLGEPWKRTPHAKRAEVDEEEAA